MTAPISKDFLRSVDEYARTGRDDFTRHVCQELLRALDEVREVQEVNRRFEADRRNLRSCFAGLIEHMHPDLGGDTHIAGPTVRFLRSMFGISYEPEGYR